ncbi:MAG: DUF262 domain-containing protein [Desulfomonilaceae bacterium]|jgi:uncharacterized protein with ParB-like and HNH nuclease domain
MAYKSRTLFRLIEEINGGIYLPHIQRPFVWDLDQMLKLFDSLMRNYPIQTFLFWRTKDEIKARKFMEQIEWDPNLSNFYEPNISKEGCEKVFVLDGQQRLQTLYAIFRGAIMSEKDVRQEAYFNITSGEEINDSGLLYELKFIEKPCDPFWYRVSDLLGKDAQRNVEELADQLNDILDGLKQTDDITLPEGLNPQKDRARRVRRNISQLISILREDRHFWVEELDGVANKFPYKTVLDIFVRVNSGGTKLDASDLMFAAMKEGWQEIEEAIDNATGLLNGVNLQFDKTFVLKCLLVAHGKGSETSEEKFKGDGGEKLLQEIRNNWDQSENVFHELRDFMANDLKICSDKVIRSYTSFIPLFDFLYQNPKPNERSRALMKGYYYKAQLFGWYSQGTDTIVNALHSIVAKSSSGSFPMGEILQYFEQRGAPIKLIKSHLTQNRHRFILLNLIYVDQMGASPFDVRHKGNQPQVDHIYPRYATMTNFALNSSQVNTLGNYRFVGAMDNNRKRAEHPASYFSKLKAAGIVPPQLELDKTSDRIVTGERRYWNEEPEELHT